MKICGIYKITSPSGKIYIGQSVNIFKRKSKYKKLSCHQQPKIYNSINKHGWDRHKFEIIQECNPEQLNELEKYYVDLFQSFNNKSGMNLKDGGGSKVKHSKETIDKIRTNHKGMTGRKHTKETIKKQVLANKLLWIKKRLDGTDKKTDAFKKKLKDFRVREKDNPDYYSVEQRQKRSNAIKKGWQKRRDNKIN